MKIIAKKTGIPIMKLLRKKLFYTGLILNMLPIYVFSQNVTIKGTVKDVNQSPLVGVTIVEKGTTNGTITDLNGEFSISVKEGDSLVFSMVGYQSQTVLPQRDIPLQIALQEELVSIQEIVFVGYGTVKKKDVTTSVSSVSVDDLNARPLISAAAAIQGKAAGVHVIQPSGEPAAGMVVRIRGNTSITASNDPLYVVDGIPMTEINFLAPDDIESIQILKDASSAAIYGSRASNGVVLIQTKSGKKGRTNISFNSSVGLTHVVKVIESLNTAQYKELMDETGAATIPDGLTDQTDWFKETYRDGYTKNYQISVSNATDKFSYFISGGMIDELGIINVAYYKRYNLRANFENQIRKWLKIGSNIAYSDYSSNGIISGTGSNRAGVVLSVINTPKYAPIWDPDHPGQYYNNFYGAQVTSPVENMSRTADDKNKNNRLVASIDGEISFSSALKYRPMISVDRVYNNSTSFLDPIKTAWGRTNYGNASDSRSLSTIVVFDNIFTFDKSFGSHSITAMAGTSWTTSDWSNEYMTVSHFLNSDIKTLNAGNKVEQWSGSVASQWAIMSYLGRVAYNYNSKYYFTANFRADGSSKLAPGKKWGYFPSFSAAWRLSSESFLQNVTWLNDLKLRGGWGQTGNQSGIGDYSYLQLYDINRQNWWETGKSNALPTLSPSNMKNVDLTWETTTQSNVGVDLSILRNRINFSVDAYYKYTTNLLMDVPLPSTAPVSSITRNEGEMSNKGLEFTVNSRNFTGPFSWETDFNLSFNRNRVEKFTLQKVYYYGQTSEATSENVVRMTPGKPLSMFWGYISQGVDPETGDLIFKDVNGDGKITLSDKTYIGNPNPNFTFGMTNNFSYKGFALTVFLQGSQGNDIYNASRMETEGMYDAKNQSVAVLDRWRRPGQITYMPRATIQKDNLVASTRFIEDGSYLRVKSLTFSYNITEKHLQSWGINKFQIYFTAQNLLTFTRYSGFDPEVNQFGGSAVVQGIDWGTYPHSKGYIVGLNVEF
ncbi:MAG TPA: TonB-dependent receptor [Bacteroidales bacterium]|nr:TonB-dependent receptor [Bacteroidales bacterium]